MNVYRKLNWSQKSVHARYVYVVKMKPPKDMKMTKVLIFIMTITNRALKQHGKHVQINNSRRRQFILSEPTLLCIAVVQASVCLEKCVCVRQVCERVCLQCQISGSDFTSHFLIAAVES